MLTNTAPIPGVFLLVLGACNGFHGGTASDAIQNAVCDEVTFCAGLTNDGGAGVFAANPVVVTQCRSEAFIAQCGEAQATLCASAITAMPPAQCGLYAKGSLPAACQSCVADFRALPAYDGDAGGAGDATGPVDAGDAG